MMKKLYKTNIFSNSDYPDLIKRMRLTTV